jgi:nucleoredoxin
LLEHYLTARSLNHPTTASWCPPCKAFSPLLIQFYNKCAKEGKVEIIYVSSDKTIESFDEYYGNMPWLAIATDGTAVKNELAKTFQISGIPTSLVLDCKTGAYITDDARNTVTEIASGTKEQGLALIKKWKEMESVPLDQAAEKRKGGQPAQNPALRAVMYILKNPMYIFGMIYIYKYVMRTYFPSAGVGVIQSDDEDVTNEPAADEGEF